MLPATMTMTERQLKRKEDMYMQVGLKKHINNKMHGEW